MSFRRRPADDLLRWRGSSTGIVGQCAANHQSDRVGQLRLEAKGGIETEERRVGARPVRVTVRVFLILHIYATMLAMSAFLRCRCSSFDEYERMPPLNTFPALSLGARRVSPQTASRRIAVRCRRMSAPTCTQCRTDA